MWIHMQPLQAKLYNEIETGKWGWKPATPNVGLQVGLQELTTGNVKGACDPYLLEFTRAELQCYAENRKQSCSCNGNYDTRGFSEETRKG